MLAIAIRQNVLNVWYLLSLVFKDWEKLVVLCISVQIIEKEKTVFRVGKRYDFWHFDGVPFFKLNCLYLYCPSLGSVITSVPYFEKRFKQLCRPRIIN